MGSPSQLSFLPEDYLERKAQRRANAICAVLFLLVMGGITSAFVMSERQTRETDQQYEAVDGQYLSEAKRLQQVRQMTEKQKRISHQADLAASLLERVKRHDILAEVTNAADAAGVKLLDLKMESKVRVKAQPVEAPKNAYEAKKAARQAANKPAGPALPQPKLFDVSFSLSGAAQNDVQVSNFLARLSTSPLFRDANLVISDDFKIGEEKVRRFQIDMVLSPDAETRAASLSTAAVDAR